MFIHLMIKSIVQSITQELYYNLEDIQGAIITCDICNQDIHYYL